mmetsp:Transcript_87045/g.246904  ORF Transcript_87045/g.246904 Transcript_87045/m.246904 type:complete len:152 (-) Transcript_87045:681-1136(-)
MAADAHAPPAPPMPTALPAPPPPAAPHLDSHGLPDENGAPMDMDAVAAEEADAGAEVPAVAVATPRGALATRSPPFGSHALQVPAQVQGRSHALLSGILLKAPRPASTEAQSSVRTVANSGSYERPLAQEAASGIEGAKENDFDEDTPIAL